MIDSSILWAAGTDSAHINQIAVSDARVQLVSNIPAAVNIFSDNVFYLASIVNVFLN